MHVSEARLDFQAVVERAASHVLEATLRARAASSGPLPAPHRRWLKRAIDNLEKAQQDLWKARNDPWSPCQPQRHPQLELL